MQAKEPIMCSVQSEKSVPRDNCSASLGKHRDAEQLPRRHSTEIYSGPLSARQLP